jgi:hypothetical protein
MIFLTAPIDKPATHIVKFYDVESENEYRKIIGPWNTTIRRLFRELKANKGCKYLKKILWKMYLLRHYTVSSLQLEPVDTDFIKKELPDEKKIRELCSPYSD